MVCLGILESFYQSLELKYFCQLIVDNYINSDDRYPLVEGKDGHYYNIIEFIKKLKKVSKEIVPSSILKTVLNIKRKNDNKTP